MSKKSSSPNTTISVNKRAYHDYFIEDRLEAGLALLGWEVKSIRAGKVQLSESYIIVKNGEAWLFNAHITPLKTASTHIHPEPTGLRKLLLHKSQLNKLIGNVERKGYTIVPLSLYWSKNRVKLEIGLAKGKKDFDKRTAQKEKDWQREKARLLKAGS